MAGSVNTLEQGVLGIFRETREVLDDMILERDGSSRNGLDDSLEKAVARLDTSTLVKLLQGENYEQIMGEGDHAEVRDMRSTAKRWSGQAAELQLAQLALPLYIGTQNQKVAELIGSRDITATIREGVYPSAAITALPEAEKGALKPSEGPVSGTLDHARTDAGLLLLRPEGDQPPDSPPAWNVHLLGREGAQLVDLEIAGHQAPSPS